MLVRRLNYEAFFFLPSQHGGTGDEEGQEPDDGNDLKGQTLGSLGLGVGDGSGDGKVPVRKRRTCHNF